MTALAISLAFLGCLAFRAYQLHLGKERGTLADRVKALEARPDLSGRLAKVEDSVRLFDMARKYGKANSRAPEFPGAPT